VTVSAEKRGSEKPPDVTEGDLATSTPPFSEDVRVERALMAMAAFDGNGRKASAFLADDGLRVPHQTLYGWVAPGGRWVQRYEEIRAQLLPQLRARAAEEHLGLARRYNKLAEIAADLLKEKLPEVEPRDLAGAARNLSTSSAIHTDKAEKLNDQPTIVGVPQDAAVVLKQLAARGWVFDEDVQDAEVVEDGEGGESEPERPALANGSAGGGEQEGA
jgi:hypothetical protein